MLAGFACGEVRGGNGIVHGRVELPGMRGVLYSRPCEGAGGGDIHYLSICGSGLMARVCLADVAGHGSTVEAMGREIHAHLRRSVDVVDERKVLRQFNRRLERQSLRAMTTAVLATYYPPRRRLTVSYAGHPHGWLYRSRDRRWTPLHLPVPPPASRPAFIDLPLGVGFDATYHRHRFHVSPGDRMLLVTDGVLETTSPADEPFDRHGIEALLMEEPRDPATGTTDALADRLLAALHAHADADHLAHDDVTFLLAEFVEGPPGPALWHVFRNRVLARMTG
ncbi:MAG: PP2C family protein-serine/threonine phosphatase [Vicinamibacterales bacterium]